MWFYSLPKHDNLCLPAETIYREYRGATKYGNIFSLDVGPNYEGKLRKIDVETLRKVGEMIKNPPPGSRPHRYRPAKRSRLRAPGPALGMRPTRRWTAMTQPVGGAAADARSGWLEIDLGQPTLVGRAVVKELAFHRTQQFAIEYQDGQTWKTLVAGTGSAASGRSIFRP